MADARFHIVFTGQLVKGSDLATVKSNLGKIFKMDAARVEKLFSGQPVVLKKDADQATAMKFRAVLKQAGAECELRPVADPVQASAGASAPAPESRAASPAPESREPTEPSSGELETVGTIRTGGTGFSGAFSVAEVGAEMDNREKVAPPPAPDVDHLTMAQPGEVLGQKKAEEMPVAPDISHLSLKDD